MTNQRGSIFVWCIIAAVAFMLGSFLYVLNYKKHWALSLADTAESITLVQLYHPHEHCVFQKSGEPTCCDSEPQNSLCENSRTEHGMWIVLALILFIIPDILFFAYNALVCDKLNIYKDWRYYAVAVAYSIVINIAFIAILLQIHSIALIIGGFGLLFVRGGICMSEKVINVESSTGETLLHEEISGSMTRLPHYILGKFVVSDYGKIKMAHYHQQYAGYINKYRDISI
jgi:hypothetical protein